MSRSRSAAPEREAKRSTHGWAACAFVALAACGRGEPPRFPEVAVVSAPQDSEVASIALRDRLAWPYWLERIEIAVDGALVYAERFGSERRDRPTWLAHLALEPGAHLLEIRVVAGYTSTQIDGSDGCRIEVTQAHPLEITRRRDGEASEGTTFDLRVATRSDVTAPFAERLLVDVARDGTPAIATSPRVRVGAAAVCDDRAPLLPLSRR